ncbi:unnamed protein product, partial [Musa acuminata var. zebrina]
MIRSTITPNCPHCTRSNSRESLEREMRTTNSRHIWGSDRHCALDSPWCVFFDWNSKSCSLKNVSDNNICLISFK